MDKLLDWVNHAPLWIVYVGFGVLALLLARKSQVDAWVEAHPRIGGLLKTLRGVGLDPWLIVQGLCLIFFGRLPEKPVLGVKPKMPPPLTILIVAVMLTSSSATSCGGTLPPPPTHAQMVEAGKALAFNEAAVALTLLDKAEADREDGIKNPTDAQVQQASAHVALLRSARDALKEARAWILGESDVSGPEVIHQAIDTLSKVLDSLKAEGVKVPPAVDAALAAGRGYL